MIIKTQIAMFFMIGFFAWNGVDTLISHAEAKGQATMMDIMTLEQLTEIKVNDI